MANYTETEKEQSFRGNDYTGIKEDKPFGECSWLLRCRFDKQTCQNAQNSLQNTRNTLSAIPLNALK